MDIPISYLRNISSLLYSDIDRKELANSCSNTQYLSKKWLVETLQNKWSSNQPTIQILGGWYGIYLIPMLKKALEPKHIFFNDVDPSAIKYAKELHGETNITYQCFDVDILPLLVLSNNYDILINTSCEHMKDMAYIVKAKPDKMYVFQSCDNKNDPGHINVVKSSEELTQKSGISNVSFSGRLSFGYKNRFMVIGNASVINKQ